MSKTYVCLYIHGIFSTKERLPLILPEVQRPLWMEMYRIARRHDMRALAVGGTQDHAHILLSLPATIPIYKAVQVVKGASSKWIKENFSQCQKFKWQRGYGAFSVHQSFLDRTIQYIQNQMEHHRHRSFVQEYTAILQKHGFEIDDHHTWT